MTDEANDLPELEPLETLEILEPFEEAAPAGAAAGMPAMPGPTGPQAPGLPAPAFNPSADKEYYRFMFAGVIMFVGCMMPFGPEWDMAGYKTLVGAFGLIVSIGMIWTWWAAIHTAKFSGKNLKWVGLAFIVFLLQVLSLMTAFEQPAIANWDTSIGPIAKDWAEVFSGFARPTDTELFAPSSNFFRAYGTGKIVLLIGSFLAEFYMIMAIFGGAKAAKTQKAAKVASKSGGKSGRRR